MPDVATSPQDQLDQLIARPQEPGVATAIASYEAVERVYFQAVAASAPTAAAQTYATSTSPR